MADVKLVGNDSGSNDSGSSSNKFRLSRFQAEKSGTSSVIGVYVGTGDVMKLALYADSGGEPGALIASTAEIDPSVAYKYAEFPFSGVNIVSGTYYWLAWNTYSPNSIFVKSGLGTNRTKDVSYSGFSFPDPAGTGFSSYSYQGLIYIKGAESSGGSIVPLLQQQYRRRVA